MPPKGWRAPPLLEREAKTCTKCGEIKAMDDFSRFRHSRDGRHSWCRGCTSAANRVWREENHEEILVRKRAHWAANRDVLRARADAWKANNLERHRFLQRRSHLKRMYGITPEQYDELLNTQGGVCALCGNGSERRLHVDHDHACCATRPICGDCIRGLLCDTCNRLLGWYEARVGEIERYITR